MPTKEDLKEWTLMFYMASDNPLVVNMVSQLKDSKSRRHARDISRA